MAGLKFLHQPSQHGEPFLPLRGNSKQAAAGVDKVREDAIAILVGSFLKTHSR